MLPNTSRPIASFARDLTTDSELESPLEKCVACGVALVTPYCANCGERRASDRKHTLVEFAADNIEALTNFDGRAIRTYRLLLTRPGELTLEFIRGVRLRYVPPLQCFLIVNVLFFLWSTATDMRVLDASITTHEHNGIYGAVATRMFAAKVAQQHGDSVAVARQFTTVTSAQAKSLVLVMVPLFAVGVAALTIGRRRRYAVHHIVFSLHFYAFLLFLFAAVIYLLRGIAYVLPAATVRALFASGNDSVLSTMMMAGVTVYLGFALRRVYGLGKIRSTLTAFAAAFVVFLTFVTYRALLFFITMASM